MVFSLLLANITVLLCFSFLFSVVVINFPRILVKIHNAKLKLAHAIPAGAPMTVANDATEMLPVITDKTIKY